MGKVRDLTGQRFGDLVAVERAGRTGSGKAVWRWRCQLCGGERVTAGDSVTRGAVTHCGCAPRQPNRQHTTRHRWKHANPDTTKRPEYAIWVAMKARCGRIKGYRDVRVCQRWLDRFEWFLADMGERPSPDHSIDRKDPYGHYEPGNCRWATRAEQAANKRGKALQNIQPNGRSLNCDLNSLSCTKHNQHNISDYSVLGAILQPSTGCRTNHALQIQPSKTT